MVLQPLGSTLQQCLTPFNQLKSLPESADYRLWRYSFLQGRLRLCLWLACACLFTFIVRDVYDSVFPLQESLDIPQELKDLFLKINGVMATLLILCLVLQRTEVGQRHPVIIFLGLSWSITLVPQIITSLNGFPLPDILGWSLVFLTQAALIPVCWRLHLFSQLGAIAYYLLVYPLLHLTLVQGHSIYSTTVLLYLFWFCFICNLAVYLYERLQKIEFESRCELQAFLHTLTHDLRTPVMGASMVLKTLLNTPEEQIKVNRQLLERMLQGSDRQICLLDALLEAHSREELCLNLHREAVYLNELVERVLNDLEPLMTKNQVVLHNGIVAHLPSIDADPSKLVRVLRHLLINALKHNPPGICLSLDAAVEGSMLRCIIQDNGVGMTAQQCQRLFEPYTKGQRARYVPGLGLGLYLCQQIVHAHGGQIGVTSVPQTGATFWFTIPLRNVG